MSWSSSCCVTSLLSSCCCTGRVPLGDAGPPIFFAEMGYAPWIPLFSGAGGIFTPAQNHLPGQFLSCEYRGAPRGVGQEFGRKTQFPGGVPRNHPKAGRRSHRRVPDGFHPKQTLVPAQAPHPNPAWEARRQEVEKTNQTCLFPRAKTQASNGKPTTRRHGAQPRPSVFPR